MSQRLLIQSILVLIVLVGCTSKPASKTFSPVATIDSVEGCDSKVIYPDDSKCGYVKKVSAMVSQLGQYQNDPAGRNSFGSVQAKFLVRKSGRVENIRIVHSTQRPNLDQMVIDAIHQVSPLPAPPPGLADMELTMEVHFPNSEVSPSDQKFSGGLLATDIHRGVWSQRRKIRACYDRILHGDNINSGQVILAFEVDADGQPSHCHSKSSSFSNPRFERCTAAAICEAEFPRSKSITIVESYPIYFEGSGKSSVN